MGNCVPSSKTAAKNHPDVVDFDKDLEEDVCSAILDERLNKFAEDLAVFLIEEVTLEFSSSCWQNDNETTILEDTSQNMIEYEVVLIPPPSYVVEQSYSVKEASVAFTSKDEFFVDSGFPPTIQSLTFSGNPDFADYLDDIVWKRPFEIHPQAKMISDGMTRSDINQQALGDCWFVAACSAVADNRSLLARVVLCHSNPLSGQNYKGGPLRFQFHQNGDWREVVIDDYLPVRCIGDQRYQLLFSKSTQDDEMWVSLLEKAYAKLKGSYEALVGGNATCALSDLTGGITEALILEEEDAKTVWSRLNKAINSKTTFATASCGQFSDSHENISENEIGLMQSHAYSVVTCTSFTWKDENVKLVRLRNPWATFEYKGPWGDSDPVWENAEFVHIAHQIGFEKKADGEFFMEFHHFLSMFRGVTICTVHPQFIKGGDVISGHAASIKGGWVRGVNAGGCMNFRDTSFPSNPQYLLHLGRGATSCIISLLQFHPPSPAHKVKFFHCGLYVYELKRDKTTQRKLTLKHFQFHPIFARNKLFSNFQEVVVRTNVNSSHSYVIIPCTFQPDKEAQFVIRVFADSHCELTELK